MLKLLIVILIALGLLSGPAPKSAGDKDGQPPECTPNCQ
jgi:hypothetical protein